MAPYSMCSWCCKSSQLNKFVLPLWKANRFFCSLSCLLEFKLYMFCGLCGAETFSSEQKLSSRVILKLVRKGFCSKQCLGLFIKYVAHLNPDESQVESGENQLSIIVNEDENNVFCWEKYLTKTGSTAAPHCCFNQNEVPLTNEFVVGMKLESRDPRNFTSYCIATVIAVVGPRIQLRLDGSDDRNDFWRLVDEDSIHPIGYCESLGEILQPPLGFQRNPLSWVNFMIKSLIGADASPNECFKLKPTLPSSNNFRVGEKLEAVDRKNPHLICPATIVFVEKDCVEIHFDGWRVDFGYRCRYDSRDLFPVGWCEKNRHPLLPPGKET